MRAIKLLSLFFLFAFLIDCERVKYFPDNPINFEKTVFIAHKGGGYFDEGNTLKACEYGLSKLGGIECDIQRSSDNVLYLSHSSTVPSCGSYSGRNFASLSSETIDAIDTCLGSDKDFVKLEAIFAYMSANYPDKYISLDVKAWSSSGIGVISIISEMNELAQKIIDLTKKYHLEHKVMVESETGDFLYYILKHSSGIETYLSCFGDFELGVSRALNSEFSGISFQYKFKEPINKQLVELIHKKGLKIQLWTVKDEDIKEAMSINPDFIQTDNVEYVSGDL